MEKDVAGFRAFLGGCASMGLVLAAVFQVSGAKSPVTAHFDEITVGRINIEEPDGTKRLVISNRTQFPGDFVKGKETPRPDRRTDAGMLFINDEGTEDGGLVFNGTEMPDGRIDAGLSLTFDRFRQDQSLQLTHQDDQHGSRSALVINDSPFYKDSSMDDLHGYAARAAGLSAAQRQAYWQQLRDEGRALRNRIYLGTTDERSASLTLKDPQGRPRMELLVSAQGKPEIRMLDEAGKVVKVVVPD